MNVKTAIRTLEVFATFAHEGRPQSLSELGRLLAIPLSSCLALIKTYQMAGYLYEVPRRIGYYPTRRIVDVAERSRQTIHCWSDSPRGLLRCAMKAVKRWSSRSCSVCGSSISTFASRIRLFDMARVPETIGSRTQIRSAGPAGAMEMQARRDLLRSYRFTTHTKATIVSREAFERDLVGRSVADATQIQASAWRISLVSDVQSKRRGGWYAVSIAGPCYRLEPLPGKHAQRLMKTCEAIAADPWARARSCWGR
jgi:DNA-binding IclR family transcriptional regulator